MELERKDTAEVMGEKKATAPAQCAVICCMLIMTVWIPICNSMALGNFDSDNCGADLAEWFWWHTVLVYAVPPVLQIVSLVGAVADNRAIYKFGQYLHTISGIAGTGVFIWGITLLNKVDDPGKCSKDSVGFDPYEYLKIVIIVTAVAMGVLCLCMCIAIPCAALVAMSQDDCGEVPKSVEDLNVGSAV